MTETKGFWALAIILAVASFFRLYNLPLPSYAYSAAAGVLTVLGLYLFTKEILNQEIALLSSYFMAVSFWHVLFSRMETKMIFVPLILTWAFYFFWKGLRSSKLMNFGLSGILFGAGFYVSSAFRAAPIILIPALAAYWSAIKRDFGHDRYTELKNRIIKGSALTLVVALLVFIPRGIYFLDNPGEFFGRVSQISVFSETNSSVSLAKNFLKTLGMFNFAGDGDWSHNYPGASQLAWPVGILFAFGLIKTFINLFKHKKEHGHISTIPLLLLSWLFIMSLAVAVTNYNIPNALISLILAPPVFIMAGKGAWWAFEYMTTWYDAKNRQLHKVNKWAVIALVLFLGAIGVQEYRAYFVNWLPNPNVQDILSR